MHLNYNLKHNLRKNWALIVAICIYSILGLILFKYFVFITGVDGICYMSIAQKYATGDISNAINGYWSPLFSWLLTPFIIKGFTPLSTLISGKILSLIIGLFTLIGLHGLSYRFKIDKTIRTLFVFSLIIPILCFAFTELTSDLLMACALVYCLVFLLDPNYPNNHYNGVLCGFAGSLAYLSKSFAFPFFLVLFVLFNFLYYFKKFKDDKRVLKNFVLGFVVFFLISGSWMLVLNEKYGEWTIGTSGEYNYNALGPEVQLNHPMNMFGVVKPPNNSAVNGWEDPSYVKLKSWSPFQSWSYFQYQLKIIGENILGIIILMFWFSPILLLIMILGCITYRKSSDKTFKWGVMSLIITISLFIMGYLPFFVQPRYFYLVYFLSFLLGSFILSAFIQKTNLNKILKNLLLFVFFFLLVVLPCITLVYHANSYGGIYELSETLSNDYHVHGNIASDSEALTSLYMSYLLDSSYYGAITTNTTDLDLQLKINGIDYYLVWNTNDNVNLEHYKEIDYPNKIYPRLYIEIINKK